MRLTHFLAAVDLLRQWVDDLCIAWPDDATFREWNAWLAGPPARRDLDAMIRRFNEVVMPHFSSIVDGSGAIFEEPIPELVACNAAAKWRSAPHDTVRAHCIAYLQQIATKARTYVLLMDCPRTMFEVIFSAASDMSRSPSAGSTIHSILGSGTPNFLAMAALGHTIIDKIPEGDQIEFFRQIGSSRVQESIFGLLEAVMTRRVSASEPAASPDAPVAEAAAAAEAGAAAEAAAESSVKRGRERGRGKKHRKPKGA